MFSDQVYKESIETSKAASSLGFRDCTLGLEMASLAGGLLSRLYGVSCDFLRKCLWRVVTFGPIPKHVAVIMDGNRRFARNHHLKEGAGHRYGFVSLMSTLRYCYEMGVEYVTIYAFSIDNFKRRPDEVQYVMDLMHEKLSSLLKEESLVNQYGVRVTFIGNLKLMPAYVRETAERAMEATAKNDKAVLSICVAYTSTDEITRAVRESCNERRKSVSGSKLIMKNGDKSNGANDLITVSDLERHMYTAGYPELDILIRTSGETRLSNYLLWQSSGSFLHISDALWPEFALRHVLWAVLEYQRAQPYLEKKRKMV
ncbi:hypothetical protein AMTR_s00044p00169460 [Amborella trichopoda]|uniref:Alkyl transferase n=1 Tax=Amborella trichopoda TaxID=13333 RepID=U5D721_AMBTC|nr:hypothetical protein AMTR_s00044p00169460 [Amborella trichopoda]